MAMRRPASVKRYVTKCHPIVDMERVVEHELLDRGDVTAQEIERSLRSLARINRCFGGDALHARLVGRALARVPHGRTPQILEVASGHATVLRNALQKLRRSVEVTLLDMHRDHLPDPQSWPLELTPRTVKGDALALPFADASMDIVSCCLFLHHLDPQEVTRFLSEASRVARVAVVINDLERSATHYALARLHSLFDPSRLSRHDGPVSVRRAYTFGELAAMLAASGANVWLTRAFLFRLGAIVWCSPRTTINAPGMPSPRSSSAVSPREVE